jgi:Zn-dependent protease with chaperone function
MDFFGHQDQARFRTRVLVLLFSGAVVLSILFLYLFAAVLLNFSHLAINDCEFSVSRMMGLDRLAAQFRSGSLLNFELVGWVTVIVLSVLIAGSSFKLWQLSRGGGVVAELLGGRLIDLHTTDDDERRLLNIVEEMSVAAGLPVPDIYLLDGELGINAFAAGRKYSDAAIGVTFGALKLLTRDELQGVLAHEFSHILNGDMRLNMRLIGWLHGFLGLMIVGSLLMFMVPRSKRTDSDQATVNGTRNKEPLIIFWLPFLFGCACVAAGWIGAFHASEFGAFLPLCRP